jgi:hypothetical protein
MGRVRLITPDDYDALAALMSAFPWEGITDWSWRSRIDHWWEHNPAFGPDWERGWLIEHDGRPVGLLGSVPRRVVLDQATVPSSNATTWWVHPDHRQSSLLLLARWAAQPVPAHFNSTGSANTIKAMEAFRFAPYPGETWRRESLQVVDSARMATVQVRRHLSQVPGSLLGLIDRAAALAGPFVDGLLRLRLRLSRSAASYRTEVLDHADDRFDGLSAQVARRYRLTAARDRASLNWYLQGEAAGRKVLLAASRGAELAGFALLLQRPSGSVAELPVLDCVDLAYDRADDGLVMALLLQAAEVARARQVPLVVWRHFDEFLAGVFTSAGLLPRAGPPRREYAKLPSGLSAGQCYVTQFHGDLLI